MPAPYSNDLRRKVIEACECGVDSVGEIAEHFLVSKRFVYRLRKRVQDTQSIVPKQHGGGRPPAFSEEQCNELRHDLNHHTDATLEALRQACGVNCSLETVSQTWKRMGITRKTPLRASEQDREDVQAERLRFQEEMRNEAANRCVFLDESGAKTNMTRTYGWAEKGKRVYGSTPYGHGQTATMIGSVRMDGQTTGMTLDGPVDTEAFVIFLQQVLGPTLREGDIVILDNLPSHKSAAVKETIESFGARVRYLPCYSPDFNPIEMMWSKIKRVLKRAKARTEEALIQAIAKAFQDVKPSHAFGWFKQCGYVTTLT